MEENIGFGNQEAYNTMLRSSYGNQSAAYQMAAGGVISGGISTGMNNMFADLGRAIRPISYTPPAAVETGFYGQQQETLGFFSSTKRAMGFLNNAWGRSDLQGIENASEDFGQRVSGGFTYGLAAGTGIALGSALSPIMGSAGRSIGSAFLEKTAGSVLGFAAGPIGGYLAGSAAVNAVMEGVEARQKIQDMLAQNSFRFVGAGSKMVDPITGRGMSKDARSDVAELVRTMDIADPTLNTNQLTSILEGSVQKGLFNGTQDLNEFKDRFKTIVENVKKVGKVLNQSLEEALATIKEFRGIGVDQKDIGTYLNNSQSTGMVAGRTASEMVGLGLQGAEMFRGTGVNMGIGFASTQMNLATVRATRDAKLLSSEAIAQAGGEEALAMRMTASSLGFAQSQFGRGYGAAFYDPRTGGANVERFMDTAFAGGGDMMTTFNQAANMLSDPSRAISYEVNQQKMLNDLGKKFGPDAMQVMQDMSSMAMASHMAKQLGTKTEDVFKKILLDQGVSQAEIEARIARMNDAKGIYEKNIAAAGRTRDEKMVQEIRDNSDLVQAFEKIGDKVTKVTDTFAKPLEKIMDNVSTGIKTAVEEKVYGIKRGSLADVDYRELAAVAGDVASKRRDTDLTEKSWFGGSAGEALERIVVSGNLGSVAPVTVDNLGNRTLKSDENGDLLLDRNSGFGPGKRISTKQKDAIVNAASRLHNVFVKSDELLKDKANKDIVETTKSRFSNALISGDIKHGMKLHELVAAVTGETDITKVNDASLAAIIEESKGINYLNTMLEETRNDLAGVSSVNNAIDTSNIRKVREEYDAISSKISQQQFGDYNARGTAKAMGGLGPLGKGALDKMAVIHGLRKKLASGDYGPEEQEKISKRIGQLTSEVVKIQANATGKKVENISYLLDEALNDTDVQGLLTNALSLGKDMAQIQEARSTSAYGQLLDVELRASGLSGSKDAQILVDKLLVGSDSDKARALTTLSRKDEDVLSKMGGVGRSIINQADLINKIKGAESSADLGEILSKSSLKDDRNKIADIIETYSNRGIDAALGKAYELTSTQMVSDNVVSGGGASGAVGTATGTSQADYINTVRVQLSILNAFEAMARELKAGRR